MRWSPGSLTICLLPWVLLWTGAVRATDADALLNQARTLVQKHHYEQSRRTYKNLIARTTDDKERAGYQRELDYVLPYYEADFYYRQGVLAKAQAVIVEALRVNRPYPDRVQKLKKLGVQILAARQDGGGEKAPDEKTVARRIGDIFKAYYRKRHSYPVDYEALNQLLPPEKGLLRWYDVIGYKGGKRFYSIQLRNRMEKQQVIDLSGGSMLP